jgi:hypothetical protein
VFNQQARNVGFNIELMVWSKHGGKVLTTMNMKMMMKNIVYVKLAEFIIWEQG